MRPSLLIVDDEPLVRKALLRALATAEVDLDAVGSAAEARARLDHRGSLR